MNKWKVSFRIIATILSMTAAWTVTYFLTEYLYRLIGIHPSEYIRLISNSLLGFVLFGLTVYLYSLFFRKRHMDIFLLIIDALKRIAKGDFAVKLPVEHDHRLNVLVQNINQMAEELQEMEEMRQEFISNVSHEIQSPLTSIRGFAQVLQQDQLGAEERMQYLKIIETESNRLSKLSDNLLKLTSLESRHHPFEPKSYRLDKQLQNIVLACETQWLAKNIEMDIELDEHVIVADEDMLSQIWVNLLSNSIKFTPNGGTIGIQVERDTDYLIIQICDTGIGMDQQDQAHIFERFYKADKSRNRAQGGNGLGLSIVKKIVEMHHGEIDVASKPGEGSTFSVKLPLVCIAK